MINEGKTVRITTEWNFTNENFAKDWSIVAWGEEGPISLTHNKGWESDSLPYIDKLYNGLTLQQKDFADWVEDYDLTY